MSESLEKIVPNGRFVDNQTGKTFTVLTLARRSNSALEPHEPEAGVHSVQFVVYRSENQASEWVYVDTLPVWSMLLPTFNRLVAEGRFVWINKTEGWQYPVQTGMTFSWALSSARAGIRVRRKSWQTGRAMTVNTQDGVATIVIYLEARAIGAIDYVTAEDMMAKDWEVDA